jgi:hypothetical protein
MASLVIISTGGETMSIVNNEPVPQQMIGKIIQSIASGVDEDGYGFVEFRFTDGTIFNVREVGQTGEIKWTIPHIPSYSRDGDGYVTR